MPNANNSHYKVTPTISPAMWKARHKGRLARIDSVIDLPQYANMRGSLQAEIARRHAHLEELADGKG
jgi:hypothetical protein